MSTEIEEYISFKKALKYGIYDTNYINDLNINFITKKLEEYKDYFDHLYDLINPNISLDTEQRIAILTDEDYNLIIAGAGSGKTTTMIGKIKYLIDKCNVDPSEILAISFAKKNVEELDEKLNKTLKLNVKTSTFHALGMSILNESEKKEAISDNVKQRIYNTYIEEELYNNKEDLNNFMTFLCEYLDADKDIKNFKTFKEFKEFQKNNLYTTLKENLGEYNKSIINQRSKYRRTINNEFVRSNEELKIANFLYLNNIEYEYEKRYVKGKLEDKVYHPDFTLFQGENEVYLEHFGINQNGTSEYYSVNGTNKYNHNIDLKKQLHAKNGTVLISTFSKFNDNRPLLEHLRESLVENGFILNPRSDEEIFNKIVDTSRDKYIVKYWFLANDFISKFKLKNYSYEDFDSIIKSTDDERTILFIKTIKPLYLYYQKQLENNRQIDFEDMIVKATNKLDSDYEANGKKYKYLIIDEYQDISKARFELIKKIADYFSSNIIAVGDDWQAIFSFAGSNVELFTKFQEEMGYAQILRITNTYRNAQELIDVAGEFVQKDENNLKKTLHSNKHIDKPVCIYSYDDTTNNILEKAKALSLIISDLYKENKNQKILLLGRYNHDMEHLVSSGLFKYVNEKIVSIEEPKADISFTTVHKSKGLEYDNIVIINAIDSTYGFPSKVKDDPIFKIFGENDNSYAEERRLFYVALTRTKNKVSILVPNSKPSPFVIELKNNINVEFKDDVIEQYNNRLISYTCPKCGCYLRKEYFKDLDQYIYVCTTDNNVCDFKTTELEHKIDLKTCPDCDGYIIFKTIASNGSIMLGCTNYKIDDNKSCQHVEFIKNVK